MEPQSSTLSRYSAVSTSGRAQRGALAETPVKSGLATRPVARLASHLS